jgi:hypothetical protein
MEQHEEWQELCDEREREVERDVNQARLLLMEIGTYLNLPDRTRISDQRHREINKQEAIRNEGLFNKTLDKIEKLSRLIYWRLDNLNESGSLAGISPEDLECLLWASAYINNLVRKVETVGECTGTRIRGPWL